MPQIIVTADRAVDGRDAPMMLRERVSLSDFESEHFRAQLVERLGWAVGDAHEVEQPDADEADGTESADARQPDYAPADGTESADARQPDYAPASMLTTAS
jgi:hypothetical protein